MRHATAVRDDRDGIRSNAVFAATLVVITDVPAPGAGIVEGLNMIVEPCGAPEADRLIAPLKAPISRVETSIVPYHLPDTDPTGTSMAKVGAVDTCCTPR